MAKKYFPLKNHERALSSSIEFQENSILERRDSSKMYLRHLRKRQSQAGLCSVLSTQRNKIMSKNNLHSRITEDFEKLYDTSPKSKKLKLENARICGYKNTILAKSSAIKSQLGIGRNTKFSIGLARFSSRNTIIKSLFPSVKLN